jgi:predicted GNAT family acetyltransferase
MIEGGRKMEKNLYDTSSHRTDKFLDTINNAKDKLIKSMEQWEEVNGLIDESIELLKNLKDKVLNQKESNIKVLQKYVDDSLYISEMIKEIETKVGYNESVMWALQDEFNQILFLYNATKSVYISKKLDKIFTDYNDIRIRHILFEKRIDEISTRIRFMSDLRQGIIELVKNQRYEKQAKIITILTGSLVFLTVVMIIAMILPFIQI